MTSVLYTEHHTRLQKESYHSTDRERNTQEHSTQAENVHLP